MFIHFIPIVSNLCSINTLEPVLRLHRLKKQLDAIYSAIHLAVTSDNSGTYNNGDLMRDFSRMAGRCSLQENISATHGPCCMGFKSQKVDNCKFGCPGRRYNLLVTTTNTEYFSSHLCSDSKTKEVLVLRYNSCCHGNVLKHTASKNKHLLDRQFPVRKFRIPRRSARLESPVLRYLKNVELMRKREQSNH